MLQRLSLHALGGIAFLSAGMAAGTAQAAPSPLMHHGFALGSPRLGSVNVAVDGTALSAPVHAAAGAFSVTWNSATFFTYCVELTQLAALHEEHDYERVAGLVYFGNSTLVDRLGRLFTATDGIQLPTAGVLAGWTYTAAQASAAMQLAVWEIVYESPMAGRGSFDGLSLAGGDFAELTESKTMARVRDLADSYLASAAAVTTALYDISVLRNDGLQDFLYVTRLPERNNDVPLPGTLALAGLGLTGLALVRRRRD